MILDKINSPADVKKLSVNEMNSLADEIREALFNRLTKIGGHFGPNFGFVEATIAMHYVFNSPTDKFVFDVSHQSYTHKILTGRKAGYIDDTRFAEDSGYSNPEESKHDFFNIGHTSTSVALALGLAKGRDILDRKENIVAVIGDGSLSGGEAMEALNVAGSELGSNFIIIVNDNEQAIAETHGGIYQNLKELRESNGKAQNNWFRAFGLDYIYEENGNDIVSLIKVFEKVKDSVQPVVVHIHTQKGKGYRLAEENREAWHWCMPFDRTTGKPTVDFGSGESYSDITTKYIMNKARKDKDFIVVSPAMPMSVGLGIEERKQLGRQYIDTGIAEEAAVAIASGIATNGAKPLVVTNMTFLQRAYDSIINDVSIARLPVTFCIDRAGLVGEDGVTHHGLFDLAFMRAIPGMTVTAPMDEHTLRNLMYTAQKRNDGPFSIRYPRGTGKMVDWHNEVAEQPIGKGRKLHDGTKVAILSLGTIGTNVADACQSLHEQGIDVAHYDMKLRQDYHH